MRKVSIIVPVYNVGNDLIACIESIIAQTYKSWELWLIDDGSSDGSSELCDEYGNKDNRINVWHKKNAGVSAARNSGLSCATGEYVLFVDGDDYLQEDALEILMNAAKSVEADMVICGFNYWVMHDKTVVKNLPTCSFEGNGRDFFEKHFADFFQKEIFNPPWNKLIRRSVLEENKIRFNECFSICEDMSFSIQTLENCDKIVVLQEALYNYIYKEQGNLVHKFHENYYEALSFFDECISKYMKKNHAEEHIKYGMQEFFAKKTLMYLRKIYRNSNYKNKKKYHELRRICEDKRFRQYIKKMKNFDGKKKIVLLCIKYRLYILLNLIYLLTK